MKPNKLICIQTLNSLSILQPFATLCNEPCSKGNFNISSLRAFCARTKTMLYCTHSPSPSAAAVTSIQSRLHEHLSTIVVSVSLMILRSKVPFIFSIWNFWLISNLEYSRMTLLFFRLARLAANIANFKNRRPEW